MAASGSDGSISGRPTIRRFWGPPFSIRFFQTLSGLRLTSSSRASADGESRPSTTEFFQLPLVEDFGVRQMLSPSHSRWKYRDIQDRRQVLRFRLILD